MELLRTEDLCKRFHNGNADVDVLTGITLTLAQGEMAAIVGPSGSGKTTLLQILGTLTSPTSGKLYFNNESLNKKSEIQLAEFRNHSLGFIFQFHHLLPDFSTLENVMMPGLISGKSKAELIKPAKELLKMVELDHRLDHRVNQLSGGEQQRTALARALIMKPALLLADEPTGNLDNRSGNLVFDLLHNLCKEFSLATLMVTHNMALADRMDKCFTLQDGKLLV
jgi:lipoprotein-releasing system ATP-binding protein